MAGALVDELPPPSDKRKASTTNATNGLSPAIGAGTDPFKCSALVSTSWSSGGPSDDRETGPRTQVKWREKMRSSVQKLSALMVVALSFLPAAYAVSEISSGLVL